MTEHTQKFKTLKLNISQIFAVKQVSNLAVFYSV